MKILLTCLAWVCMIPVFAQQDSGLLFCGHPVILDGQGKLLPRKVPAANAYDHFLRLRWNFVQTKVPLSPGPAPRSNFPQYYFYCAFVDSANVLLPDKWMNDVGEKIPMWFESARLFYTYSGDSKPLAITKGMVDYALQHGISPAGYAWPNFPQTAADAGATEFRGFTTAKRFSTDDVQVDHAGDMGATFYKMFLFYDDTTYRSAAIKVANTLARKAMTGNATNSPWPYVVNMKTGKTVSAYGTNWFGCIRLFTMLIEANSGDVTAYKVALKKLRNWILQYPVKNGLWVDGHSDTYITGTNNLSNLSASNAGLYLSDFPDFDPGATATLPRLIKWTEENFVHKSAPGEPSSMWGANLVSEQVAFMPKMDYQTARYAAQCARWYAVSGDTTYMEKAFRSLNWVTYCNDSTGKVFESPVSKGVNSWWSDSYGECPLMFYYALSGIPEWAPSREDHMLYSSGIVKNISYGINQVQYLAAPMKGTDYLRLSFKPVSIEMDGVKMVPVTGNAKPGYVIKDLQQGDYAIEIRRVKGGKVTIAGPTDIVSIDGAIKYQQMAGIGVNANTSSWKGKELEPALDLLLDSMHATIWRVIVETVEKWEEINDDNDPFHFNWDYYNRLYKTEKFEKAWSMLLYMNQRGITDQLMINFMGVVPQWMGGELIKPEYEDEYIEMLVSFFQYARNERHIRFGLVSLMNEPDIRKEGPTVGPEQYVRLQHKLITRMQAAGMGDVQYVAPDVAGMQNGVEQYIPALFKDTLVMSRIAHLGLHSYSGYVGDIDSLLKQSAYPGKDYWVTEWNNWCNGCDDGKLGEYNYSFADKSIGYLLDFLKHGATAGLVWEGYDSYYEHHAPAPFSYWGMLAFDAKNKRYSPRKNFYALQQVSRFLQPGSWRVAVSGETDSLVILSFYNEATKNITIIGINRSHLARQLLGTIRNLPVHSNLAMYYTSEQHNLKRSADIAITNQTFTTEIPADCIFTLTSNSKPEPADWYTGDIHVHKNCGDDTILPESKLPAMMEPNDLAVIAVLADMGNGEVKNAKKDLFNVTGKDDSQSQPGKLIHWDAEWHWDATYSQFTNQALGGHLVLLGLQEAHQIWEESPYKILEWGRKQGAISGFAHFQYLNDSIQNELNCCIPVDYPVEAAMGTIDFVSEDVFSNKQANNGTYNSEAAIQAYYKLLNCGFRPGLAAGTDYPCNNLEPLGSLLTYVKVKDGLTYRKWIEGIKNGNTVVSRNGHKEFLEMTVNGKYGPGDELKFAGKTDLGVSVNWTTTTAMAGRIELVCNGKVVATQTGKAALGEPLLLTAKVPFEKSGWIIARRMDDNGHQSHTAATFITINNKPVRASADDARFFIQWIDQILENTAPGGKWNNYFSTDLDTIRQRYTQAKIIYQGILKDCEKMNAQ